MADSRDIRRCALQALYQLDVARGDIDDETLRESLIDSAGGQACHQQGCELARAVWAHREQADAAISALTPDWPLHRQPVIDRCVLRLGHYEMTTGETPPKVAINEAVDLAREFSTEKSPMFVNGVLDKMYRELKHRDESADDDVPQDSTESVTGA